MAVVPRNHGGHGFTQVGTGASVVAAGAAPVVDSHAVEDERAYGALGRSAEAPPTDSGFGLQPADMEQVNCEIAYLETTEAAAALAHRPPEACHSAETYGRRAADDRDDDGGAADYGGAGAAHYASSGAGASSSTAASTKGYAATTGGGFSTSTAYTAGATPFLAQYGTAQGWTPSPAFGGLHRHRHITVRVATRSRRGRYQPR